MNVKETEGKLIKEKGVDLSKIEFVSLASHQLKTPSTAIKLLTERMLSGRTGKITKKQKEYLEDISSSNQRMIDIINTLLNVSHVETGTFGVESQQKDIGLVVKNILHELAPVFEKKHLNLVQVYQENLKAVSINEPLFRMVINNIVTNAITYSPNDAKIHVECRQAPKGKLLGRKMVEEDSIAVIVTDEGFGIPKDQQDKLFTKFFRADNARQKQTNGTGLGLYIVKFILDNAGGSIWFSSEENKGSVFYVTIPLTGMKPNNK